jgi:glutathione S-transferase
MKLLYTKRSPYARKVKIIALEKNLKVEYIEENLTQKSDLLLRSNPVGKIPTLIRDNGDVICDSPLICEYLDSLNESPRFIPKDPSKRLNGMNLAAMADGLMDITVACFMEKTRHPKDFNPDFIRNSEEAIQRCLTFFENVVGELKEFNIVSVGLISALGYLQFRLPKLFNARQYPHLTAWIKTVSIRKSVQETMPVG